MATKFWCPGGGGGGLAFTYEPKTNVVVALLTKQKVMAQVRKTRLIPLERGGSKSVYRRID